MTHISLSLRQIYHHADYMWMVPSNRERCKQVQPAIIVDVVNRERSRVVHRVTVGARGGQYLTYLLRAVEVCSKTYRDR